MINKDNVLKKLGVEELDEAISIYEDGLIYFKPEFYVRMEIETPYEILKTFMNTEKVEENSYSDWQDMMYEVFVEKLIEKIKELGFEFNDTRPQNCIYSTARTDYIDVEAEMEFVKEVADDDECVNAVKKLLDFIQEEPKEEESGDGPRIVYRMPREVKFISKTVKDFMDKKKADEINDDDSNHEE